MAAKKKTKTKNIIETKVPKTPEIKTFLKQRTKPDIHIIGAGGIGGNLIYHMYRDRAFLKDMIGTIYLYDGDKVEQKNLLRQNFRESDVGQNKATALFNTYGKFINIKPIPDYFDPSLKTGDIKNIDTISSNSIIICCVDNIRTRCDILGELWDISQELGADEVPLFIDCGNETYHGNTIYCHNTKVLWNYYQYLESRKGTTSDAPYHRNCADYAPGDEGFIQIYHVNNLAAMYASIYLAKNLDSKDRNWDMFASMAQDGHMFTLNGTRILNSDKDFVIEKPVETVQQEQTEEATA